MTVGRSMSGKFWIFIARKLIRPTSVSMMNSSTAGIGLRIDQAETFIGVAPRVRRCGRRRPEPPAGASTTRTRSPSARKPPPGATTRAVGVEARR